MNYSDFSSDSKLGEVLILDPGVPGHCWMGARWLPGWARWEVPGKHCPECLPRHVYLHQSAGLCFKNVLKCSIFNKSKAWAPIPREHLAVLGNEHTSMCIVPEKCSQLANCWYFFSETGKCKHGFVATAGSSNYIVLDP